MSNNEGRRWMARLGLSRDDVDFWLIHDALDKIHGAGAFDAVVKYLPQNHAITRDEVMQAVEDSMFAWKVFLDGIAEAAEGEAIAQ